MLANAKFILRYAVPWFAVYLVTAIVLRANLFEYSRVYPGLAVGGGFLLTVLVAISAVSHLRRVRLILGTVGTIAPAMLASRQRRQIEVPFEAGDVFDMVDAAIRELPGSSAIQSARDSLQVHAHVERHAPYAGLLPSAAVLHVFDGRRNQISATVTPCDTMGSVTLICEPRRAVWTDWLLVDDGINLENAEAVTRSLMLRVAQRRRKEQDNAQQSATEKELTTAKLNLLQAQVEPHFLYNTLASAQILTRTDPARADDMLGNLILYLRHAVPTGEASVSSVGAELERTRAYLDIMTIRMGARLTLQIDVPALLLPVPLPTMMLQTLVENAIKHGLEPKPGGGTIWITARKVGSGSGSGGAETVTITVADDGRGFSLDGAGTGIGLRNVRARLQLIYGAAASFAIVANFPGGVAATITVPAAVPAQKKDGERHA